MLKVLVILLLVFFVLSLSFKINKNRKTIFMLLLIMFLIPCNAHASAVDDAVEKYLPLYQKAMKAYGVPASFMIAIGIHETSLGTNPKAVTLNRGTNLHAIGYHEGCYVVNSEGRKWQKYSSAEDSINDLGRLLSRFDKGAPYKCISCLDKSKYPTRDAMIDCLIKRINTYAPSSDGNNTESYKKSVKEFMKKHEEYDEGLPSYDEAMANRADPSKLPEIHYGEEDENCYEEYNYDDEGEYDPTEPDFTKPFYGIPSKLHFTTSYGGDLKQGWLYLRTKAYEDPRDEHYDGPDIMDDAIDEIFYRAMLAYTAENTYGGNKKVKTGMEGKLISGKGVGEEIPDDALDELGNPLGDQGCNQSSCFGYYSKTNCTSHSGVDLTSSSNASILSAGDGVVKGVNRNNRQCIPDFSKKPICDFASGQCSGNIVTIEHTINGKKWTTKYVHMKSISSSITVGAHVSKGQTIGIIGTTGCSTGIHLHFEIIGPDGKLYNPEQLLANSCNLKAGCDEARRVCK